MALLKQLSWLEPAGTVKSDRPYSIINKRPKTSPTKALAFEAINSDGTRQTRREQVLAIIKANPGYSRADIAEVGNMRLASVCGRVNEIIAAGEAVEIGVKHDCETGKAVARIYPA